MSHFDEVTEKRHERAPADVDDEHERTSVNHPDAALVLDGRLLGDTPQHASEGDCGQPAVAESDQGDPEALQEEVVHLYREFAAGQIKPTQNPYS